MKIKSRLPGIVLGGILAGALAGLLIGAYIVFLTKNHVVRRDDFDRPIAFEQTADRYAATLLLAFVAVFAAVGPFIAAASFGPWVRHAVYGLAGGIAVAVAVALLAALVTDQQPFNMHKGSQSTCIDIARVYAVPLAIVVGPLIGIATGRLLRRRGA